MSKVVKRTFSLTEEQAAFIDAKVASGGYASGSEVVREGLRSLQDRQTAVERWLRDDVAPVYDRVMAGVEPLHSAEETRAFLYQQMEKLTKAAE